VKPWFPIEQERQATIDNDKIDMVEAHHGLIVGNNLVYPRNHKKPHWFFKKPYFNQHLGHQDTIILMEVSS